MNFTLLLGEKHYILDSDVNVASKMHLDYFNLNTNTWGCATYGYTLMPKTIRFRAAYVQLQHDIYVATVWIPRIAQRSVNELTLTRINTIK
jgi:hypothetical protein